MKIGKKQLILTGLVLTLGAAVYLNWQFSGNTDLLSGSDAVSVSKELGEAEFVNTSSDKKAGESTAQKSTELSSSKESTASASKSSDEYFSQAKVAKAAELATVMEQQTNVESLIKAKGFEECMVFIQNGECSIVVRDSDLTADDALIIKDIATGQTGITVDKIKVTAV